MGRACVAILEYPPSATSRFVVQTRTTEVSEPAPAVPALDQPEHYEVDWLRI
jgi:hypothetical protein